MTGNVGIVIVSWLKGRRAAQLHPTVYESLPSHPSCCDAWVRGLSAWRAARQACVGWAVQRNAVVVMQQRAFGARGVPDHVWRRSMASVGCYHSVRGVSNYQRECERVPHALRARGWQRRERCVNFERASRAQRAPRRPRTRHRPCSDAVAWHALQSYPAEARPQELPRIVQLGLRRRPLPNSAARAEPSAPPTWTQHSRQQPLGPCAT